MATYKVIQDIEAEDHILGPLSLRQFIFAIVAIACIYFCYLCISKHVGFLCVIFLPPALFCGFFAVPFGKDQPTEVWALAKLRFLFKPRRRIWDQTGIKELVTVTAPKKVEVQRTNGLSQTEVRSRLNALASTIDSRGWAIKNLNVNAYNPTGLPASNDDSDRLLSISAAPAVDDSGVQASDDIMDEQNNRIAQQFDQMIHASSREHRQQLVAMLKQQGQAATQPASNTAAAPANYWFLNQSNVVPGKGQAVFADPSVVTPGASDSPVMAQAADPTADEQALAEKLKAEHNQPAAAYSHLKTIQPLGQGQPASPSAMPTTPAPMPAPTPPASPTNTVDAAALARNNDLNIATLSRIANRQDEPPADDGEVVVSLH